ncbi:hypothetical protein AN958_00134 [Leucoagaricus sp. SymC.cos]|nr:hypothetical protein AN958_00134 [Leucoagaricus sp. SymC.cos]
MLSLPTIFSAWKVLVTVAIIAWTALKKLINSTTKIAFPEPPMAQELFRTDVQCLENRLLLPRSLNHHLCPFEDMKPTQSRHISFKFHTGLKLQPYL